MALKTEMIISLVCALAASAPALAEPATADPTFRIVSASAQETKTIADFEVANRRLSLCARGRAAMMDTNRRVSNLQEARAMKKFVDGYPQPAYVTFDVRLWF